MSRILEVCVDTIDSARVAANNGANRIELCSCLAVGGLTPSAGLMTQASRLSVPVVAMIRPREGDFIVSGADADVMRADILLAREQGLAGIVIGALSPDGDLDAGLLADLITLAGPLHATLHRAFDLTRDPFDALECAIDLGFTRILTSGQAQRAIDGTPLIGQLIDRAAGRISVMPGGGVTPETVVGLIAGTGAVEVHASCARDVRSDPRAVSLGFGASAREVDASIVRTFRGLLDRLDEEDRDR